LDRHENSITVFPGKSATHKKNGMKTSCGKAFRPSSASQNKIINLNENKKLHPIEKKVLTSKRGAYRYTFLVGM